MDLLLRSNPSSAWSSSVVVWGSPAVTFTCTSFRRRTATGFGPRHTVVALRSATSAASSCPRFSASFRSAVAPTPVINTTTSKRPAHSASTNAVVSSGRSSGDSRTAGTEYAVPPNRSTIEAISALIRASSSAIRFPVSEAIASILLRHVARRPERRASIAKQPCLLHCSGFPPRRPSRADFEQHHRSCREGERDNHQTGCVRARRISRGSENGRKKKAAKPACRSDHARDDAHPSGKPLRHELKHRSVAHAQGADGDKQQRDRECDRWKQRDETETHRDEGKQQQQH